MLWYASETLMYTATHLSSHLDTFTEDSIPNYLYTQSLRYALLIGKKERKEMKLNIFQAFIFDNNI